MGSSGMGGCGLVLASTGCGWMGAVPRACVGGIHLRRHQRSRCNWVVRRPTAHGVSSCNPRQPDSSGTSGRSNMEATPPVLTPRPPRALPDAGTLDRQHPKQGTPA